MAGLEQKSSLRRMTLPSTGNYTYLVGFHLNTHTHKHPVRKTHNCSDLFSVSYSMCEALMVMPRFRSSGALSISWAQRRALEIEIRNDRVREGYGWNPRHLWKIFGAAFTRPSSEISENKSTRQLRPRIQSHCKKHNPVAVKQRLHDVPESVKKSGCGKSTRS